MQTKDKEKLKKLGVKFSLGKHIKFVLADSTNENEICYTYYGDIGEHKSVQITFEAYLKDISKDGNTKDICNLYSIHDLDAINKKKKGRVLLVTVFYTSYDKCIFSNKNYGVLNTIKELMQVVDNFRLEDYEDIGKGVKVKKKRKKKVSIKVKNK